MQTKSRITLDIARWQYLASQLEENAAWIAVREPILQSSLDGINLDSKVCLIF